MKNWSFFRKLEIKVKYVSLIFDENSQTALEIVW